MLCSVTFRQLKKNVTITRDKILKNDTFKINFEPMICIIHKIKKWKQLLDIYKY